MTEQYIVWALIVGIAVGAALCWFALGRLPRRTDDQTPAEREAEAAWISRTIQRRGGVAPADLVEEVLDLHEGYLAGPALDTEDFATTPVDAAPSARPGTQPRDVPRGS